MDLLRSVKDTDGKPLYCVSLILLEKHQSGQACYDHSSKRYSYDDESEDEGPHQMEEVHEDDTCIQCWVGPDDTELPSNSFMFDLDSLLTDGEDINDVFGEDPDKQEYEQYTGNAGPTLEYWYYLGAVIICPVSKQIELATSAGLPAVISFLNSSSSPDLKVIFATRAVNLLKTSGKNCSSSTLASLFSALSDIGDRALLVDAINNLPSLVDNSVASFVSIALSQAEPAEAEQAIVRILTDTLAQGRIGVALYFKSLLSAFPDSINRSADEAIMNGACMAIPRFESRLKYDDLLPIACRCSDELIQNLVNALIQHARASNITLRLGAITRKSPHINGRSAMRLLVNRRILALKEATQGGEPKFTWCQSSATFDGSKANEVEEFLHGDDETRTFYGFNDSRHAGNWANKYFGYARNGTYSADAEAGRGCVTVTKCRGHHDKIKYLHKSHLEELRRLLEISKL